MTCDPRLIAPTGTAATVDLHIQPSPIPTLVEGTGINIAAVTVDFDGQTRSGLTPSDIGADAGAFTVQAGGCASTWNGSMSTNWNTPENWTPIGVPSAASPVVIPGSTPNQPAIAGTVSSATLVLAGNSILNINSGQYNVKGNVSGVGSASAAGLGKLVLNGTGLQTITGTVILSNIEIANTSVAGVVVGSGASLQVQPTAASGSGILSFLANGKLTNSGSIVLKSNSLATASLATMPATAAFIGDMTVERKTPGTRGWYFVGSAVKSTPLAQWSEMGIRVAPKNNANIFEYTEGDTTRGTYNGLLTEFAGWKVPSSLANQMNPGNVPKGYRLFLNSTFIAQQASILSVTGAPFMQDVTAGFTFSPSTGYDGGGWNLMANPYPASIDWNAAKFDGSNVGQPTGNAFHIRNGAAANYGSYTATSATTGVGVGITTPFISSSQAFFVKATGAGTFTFKESFKNTANTNTYIRSAAEENVLRLKVSQGTNWDEAAIALLPGAATGIDAFDAQNLGGSAVDVATMAVGNRYAINFLPVLNAEQIIPVAISVPQLGSASIAFTGMESFPAGYTIFLRDNFFGAITNISQTSTVRFNITADPASAAAGRFDLVLSPSGVTSSAKAIARATMKSWPNPTGADHLLNIDLADFEAGVANISLIDQLGKTVYATKATVLGSESIQLNLSGVRAGVYSVKVQGRSNAMTQGVILK